MFQGGGPSAAPAAQPAAPAAAPGGGGGSQNGAGGADYSAQWAEYYRSIGKVKEAEAIEAQMKQKVRVSSFLSWTANSTAYCRVEWLFIHVWVQYPRKLSVALWLSD